jgi:hypothetical protein
MEDVCEEIKERLSTIDGLRVTAYRPSSIVPPAAFPDLPERINYDATYQRGSDRYPDLPVNVLVGKAHERSSHRNIWAYVSTAGPKSFKSTLDASPANPYSSCSEVTVTHAEFAIFRISGVDYLAATFTLDIIG